MNLTDTHCHLNLNEYSGDLPDIIARARNAGLYRILIPATDLDSSQSIISLSGTEPALFAAVGVHPNSGNSWKAGTLESLRSLAQHPRVVAIGEIGLDYYRDRTSLGLQKDILIKQLDLAGEFSLPVILHVRNKSEDDRSCIEDLLSILENWVQGADPPLRENGQPAGVIHSFSGNLRESQRAIRAGFYLGITGPITYKNADTLREIVKETDLTNLLVETDGPYLSPQPMRGKRNEPAHVRYIIDKISEIKGLSFSEIARQTSENAARVFKWE